MSNDRKELFTQKVVAGNRTYYFDLKETQQGAKYLSITESQGLKGMRQRIMVFEDHLNEFKEGLEKVFQFLGSKSST